MSRGDRVQPTGAALNLLDAWREALGGGGLFIVDAATPMAIVAEYDTSIVKGNGCLGAEVPGKMYIDSGGGGPESTAIADRRCLTRRRGRSRVADQEAPMKRTVLGSAALLCLSIVVTTAAAQEKPSGPTLRPVPDTPAWHKLSSLAGHWEGWAGDGEQRMPAHADVRMTGDGSAVMHVLGRDTPHEMVTMFHPDGDRLLATHYCAAHNQPRMVMIPSPAPNQLTFEFVDGTNIRPGDAHMRRVVITFHDADRHDEAWTSQENGREGPPMVFKFTRKK